MALASQASMHLTWFLLAAGGSTRLGQPKQLVDFNGQPLICHMLEQIGRAVNTIKHEIDCRIGCVLGAHSAKLKEVIEHRVDDILINRNWQDGMGGSIGYAVKQLSPKADAVGLVLCDQWRITSNHLLQIMQQWNNKPDQIIAAKSRQLNPPVIFPAVYFEELSQLSGDKGAKRLLSKYQHQLHTVPIPESDTDLDTPAQLDDMQRLLKAGGHNDQTNH